MISCNKVRRSPGRVYMPDMAYSRAYETYASTQALKDKGINDTATPVAGTIARGDINWTYPYKNDSAGYVNSAVVKNPLPPLTDAENTEAERLYLVYCGVCHGEKMDGNGPLYKGGEGPFPNKPRDLMGDPVAQNMAEGTMFHSITYGRNSMGSHASQLNTIQRWMVVDYIKNKQNPAAATSAPVADTTAKKN
ncbi:MAG: cytochrome c [Chitinophagaceae bacterium]|nr:cytochrome c [Chitinophagaceae bacterium]